MAPLPASPHHGSLSPKARALILERTAEELVKNATARALPHSHSGPGCPESALPQAAKAILILEAPGFTLRNLVWKEMVPQPYLVAGHIRPAVSLS